MMTVGYVMLGAFILVFVIAPAALLLADRYSDKAHAVIAEKAKLIKRELAARWLAEQGLTVRPLDGTKAAPVGVDEMMEIIGRI